MPCCVVITASTTAVREWLARHITSVDVWAERTTFQRRAAVLVQTVAAPPQARQNRSFVSKKATTIVVAHD
jgi:hypothetical protein